MNKGRNSVWANSGPRPGAMTQAQQPKRPDGPSQPTRGVHTQRAVVALGTGAVAQLPALVEVMRWGAVMVESTSGAGPPCRARWPAVELTGVTRQRGGREEASARRCLSVTHSVGGGFGVS
jgi:hypothetical protein